jgi:hypothetical protein
MPPEIPGGFFLMARKIGTSDLMEAPPLWSKLWLWMLSRATYKDTGNLKRGQFITTIKEMQEAMSYRVGYRKESPTKKQIRRAYEGFVEGTMIVTTKVTRGMIITILNYNKYQTARNYEGHSEGHNEIPTKGKLRAHVSKEVKEKRKNTADIVLNHYIKTVAPKQKSRQRALKNIKSHLRHYSHESLIAAADNYHSVCNGRKPEFLKDPANFYGIREPTFIDYLPDTFQPPKPQEPKTPEWF